MRNKNRNIILLSLILIIGIFLPFDIIIAPSRNLIIVDKSGSPVQNATVRQIWYQYALDINGAEDFRTDSRGIVKLPSRKISTTVFSLISGGIKQFSEIGIHASYGNYESIGIFAEQYKDKWFYGQYGIDSNIIKLDHNSK